MTLILKTSKKKSRLVATQVSPQSSPRTPQTKLHPQESAYQRDKRNLAPASRDLTYQRPLQWLKASTTSKFSNQKTKPRHVRQVSNQNPNTLLNLSIFYTGDISDNEGAATQKVIQDDLKQSAHFNEKLQSDRKPEL